MEVELNRERALRMRGDSWRSHQRPHGAGSLSVFLNALRRQILTIFPARSTSRRATATPNQLGVSDPR